METTTILYLLLAMLSSIAFSWFLYFYKRKDRLKVHLLLFSLRSFGIFAILLLIINPVIERNSVTNIRPKLTVLIDNSSSISFVNNEEKIRDLVGYFKNQRSLNNKYDVSYYSFDKELQVLDTLLFLGKQTNIHTSVNQAIRLHSKTNDPIVVVTDGNQTIGNSYQFITTEKNIYPVIVGDTLPNNDVRIEQVNVNKYSYLKNKFPVEIRVFYDGDAAVNTNVAIQHNGKTIYKKNLSLSKSNNSETIETTIESSREGVQYYTVKASRIGNEKNTTNNKKSFSVDVLKEQTNILLLTSFYHPDLGAIKKSIEVNKQRKVVIKNINNNNIQLKDYQLVMLYQPNDRFKKSFDTIFASDMNYFVITGTQTNWNFLNEIQPDYYKTSIRKNEYYHPVFNNAYVTFKQEDIGFELFPALQDVFGTISISGNHDALLFQKIAGISTQQPLLATFENAQQKRGVLFGEGIWKWRAASFSNSSSFQDFDYFISKIIQYIASNKKRERLSLRYENSYSSGNPVVIDAFYVDKNYQFDPRATLQLQITNSQTKISQQHLFSLRNNTFETIIDELQPGTYDFVVRVENQSIRKTGRFVVEEFQIEQQYTKANTKHLNQLANRTQGKSYFIDKKEQLVQDLLIDNRYVIRQKVEIKNESLIEWEYVLTLILFVFGVEWFVRKYYGMI